MTRESRRTPLLACLSALCATLASAPASEAQEDCTLRASTSWAPEGQPALLVEAFSDGPACAQAVVTLVIRGADGAALYAEAFVAAWNFLLRDADTPDRMEVALRRWIDPHEFNLASAAALPEWPAGSDGPGGEFPFYPAEIYNDRDSYEALRAADLPLYCVVAGAESGLCLVYVDGRIEEVGRQSFPG